MSYPYPTIKQAVIDMAYDNGATRRRSEDTIVNATMGALNAKFETRDLIMAEAELARMPESTLDEFLTGESDLVSVSDHTRAIVGFAFEQL